MKTITRTLIQLMLATAFLIPTVVHAATYYVATNGNNNYPGTEAQPFRTINKGASILRPGDTLYVKSGTYVEGVYQFTAGISWANPVTISAYPGHTVTIRPSFGDAYNPMYFSGATSQYIIVDGFVLDAADVPYDAVKITDGAHHIRIQNSDIKNAPRGNGILIPKGSDFVEIINNKIHDNGNSGAADGSLLHGVYCSSSDTLIERNQIYNNANNGISCGDEYYSTNKNIIIRYNLIYNNGTCPSAICRPYINGTGILAWYGRNYLIYNNVVYGNNIGGAEATTGIWLANTSSARVYNNTIYNNSGAGIYNGSGSSGAVIQNNIVFRNGTTEGTTLGGPGINATMTNNFTNDPLFISASEGNFALRADSPVRGAGVAVAEVADDVSGVLRSQTGRVDIGAYEYRPSVSSSPSAPINLRIDR